MPPIGTVCASPQIVGLVGPDLADLVGREARLQLGRGVRQQRRSPVFVGDADPGIGDVELHLLGVVDRLVGIFLQAFLAEIADQAFMQDVIAGDLGRAVARDQRERIQRCRRVADIADIVLDGEEIAVVDRDGALEDEAFAIVVFQRHRVGRRQRAGALALPHRVLVGHPDRRAGRRHPAEFGVIGVRGLRGREQHDGRRFGSTVSRYWVSATSSMRAPFSEMLPVMRGVSILMRGAAAIAASRLTMGPEPGTVGWVAPGVPADGSARAGLRRGAVGGGLRGGLCEFGSASGLSPLLLHLRHVVEILPGDQHEAGQDDGEDGVAVVGHLFTVSLSGLLAAHSWAHGRAGRARNEGLEAWRRNRGSARPCGRLAHNHVRSHGYDVAPLHQFAKPAADAVPFGSGAVLLGDGEADPGRAMVVAAQALQRERS